MTVLTRVLPPEDYDLLAAELGESPETVICLHHLRRRSCSVVIAGKVDCFSAAIVQLAELPEEPTGYGTDPAAMWALLQELTGWMCLNVPFILSGRIRELAKRKGTPTRTVQDIYHVMRQPSPTIAVPHVRRLTVVDTDLVEASPPDLHGAGFDSVGEMLAAGIAAGAIVDDRLVAIAHTSALTECYADIGVFTLPDFRGRGYASAAAAVVAAEIQANGKAPVWSCGDHNRVSLRVASKLGFEEVSRRMYVVFED